MVRKAVRTYSQIVNDFARADEEDARIRAFYEPSAAPAAVRPSADPDTLKRPTSAARKHRYAHVLDWNDDVSAIVNVDKHDGGARAGAPAAAFAADRRGKASRALTAALTCAMETASRLNSSPAPTNTHSSRLAMRLLRAAQAPLPRPASPLGSATTTPRPDPPPPDDPASAPWDPTDPSPRAGSNSPSSRPGSPYNALRASPSVLVPSGAAHLDVEERQQLAMASGTLLSANARMLYYGSTKPRAASARGRPASSGGGGGASSSLLSSRASRGGGGGGNSGSSRPFSAPSQKSIAVAAARAAPPTLQLQLPLGRASLTATWVPSPSSSSRSRPASARVCATAAGSGAFSARRSYSPPGSPSASGGGAASARRRSATRLLQAVGTAVPFSPACAVRQSFARSSHSSLSYGGGAAGADVDDAAVSAITARSLGINPVKLQQMQPKHGPSNGVVVRDPVGPQLVPQRRVVTARPFSAPPPGSPGAPPAPPPQQDQQERATFRPPSPSWAPSPTWQRAGGGGEPSPPRSTGMPPPRAAGLRREDSLRSVASGRTALTSAPSCGSVVIAAAAAAAAAAVNTGVNITRRRHAALDGARKALWSQIADAAGVAPHQVQDPDEGALNDAAGSRYGGGADAAAGGASPYLASYLSQQQQVAAAGSEANSRGAQPRKGSPGRQPQQQQRQQGQAQDRDQAHRSLDQQQHSAAAAQQGDKNNAYNDRGGSSCDGSGFGGEPSAAYFLVAAAASAANEDAGESPEVATSTPWSRRRSEQETAAGEGAAVVSTGGGGWHPASPPRRSQGSVLRVSSVIKRAGGSGAGDDDAVTLGGSKRVQWGATVWSFPPEEEKEGDRGDTDGMERGSAGAAAVAAAAELSRPPRHPAPPPPPLSVGDGGGELSFGRGAISPVRSISPRMLGGGSGFGSHRSAAFSTTSSHRRRLPNRLQDRDRTSYDGVDDDDDDDGDDAVDDLPSMEVSTAAGVLGRAHASPRTAAAATGSTAAVAAASSPPLPPYTDPAYYHLTALVDRDEDLQDWVFNVYLTDIVPGSPVARRICIASCTTVDEHKQLLVPQHASYAATAAGRPRSAPTFSSSLALAAAAASSSSARTSSRSSTALQYGTAGAVRSSPLISPAALLPWISRPEHLLGHWLRLEAFAIVPVAEKIVDAVVYMGRLLDNGDAAAPTPPKLSTLQIVDVRAAPSVAAAPLAATAPAATETGGAQGAAIAGGSSSSGGGNRPALAAALGVQQLSDAGSAAAAQARLAAEVALTGRQRPASARRGPGSTWV